MPSCVVKTCKNSSKSHKKSYGITFHLKMPVDYSNPHVIKFLTENFVKADGKRMIWFLKNKEQLEKLASIPENYKDIKSLEVKKADITVCMPTLASHHFSTACNRRRKALRDGVLQGVSQLKIPRRHKGQKPETMKFPSIVSEPFMKSIDPEVQSILYKPLPNGGRRQYLNKRNYKLPEDKYNFCETNSNVHGWRLKDSELSRQPTEYGRYFTFKRDINSRTGPQPDPAYYQKPPNEPYSKCFG